MKNSLILAAICCLSISGISAQVNEVANMPPKFVGMPNNLYNQSESMQRNFSAFEVYQLDVKTIKNYCSSNYSSKFTLTLGDKSFFVNLIPDDVFAVDYRGIIATDKGDIIRSKPENMTYIGYTDDGAKVAMTITEDYFFAYFSNSSEQFYIEPLNKFEPASENNLFVVYKPQDVKKQFNTSCASVAIENKTKEADAKYNLVNGTLAQSGCINIRYAIAIAYDLFSTTFSNSTSTADASMASIVSVLNSNYGTVFNSAIKFSIVSTYHSSSSSSSLETAIGTTVSSSSLLSSFTTWGYGTNLTDGGFGVFHDDASLWVKRNVDNNSVVGLAYVGSLCSSNRYNILEYFTMNTSNLGGLASHEIGHNFSCQHDAVSNLIMSPSLTNPASTTWSSASISSVNTQISSSQCQAGTLTALQGSPMANFTVNGTECINKSIALTDASGMAPTSWSWSMPNGTPSSSSTQNTSVSYSTSGSQTITLTAANSQCSSYPSNSLSKTITIINQSPPTTACSISTTNANIGANYDVGIYNVTFNTINNSSSSAYGDKSAYFDFSCSNYTTLSSLSNSISITFGTLNFQSGKIYVDINNDGTFQSSELYLTFSSVKGTQTSTLTLPSTILRSVLLRMRIVCDFSSLSACTTPSFGQTEDYGIIVPANLPVELTSFIGQKNGNKNVLNWQTSSEINSARFDIQRSLDGENFATIGSIGSKGNSTTLQNYSFIDELPAYGINYYRLNQVDLDGRTSLSKTISILDANFDNSVRVFPNPANKVLNFSISDPNIANGTISIYNLLGVLQIVKPLQAVTSTQNMDISELATGEYIVRIRVNSNKDVIMRVFVQSF